MVSPSLKPPASLPPRFPSPATWLNGAVLSCAEGLMQWSSLERSRLEWSTLEWSTLERSRLA